MKNKVEQYLIESMYNFQELEENSLWLLDDKEHGLVDVAIAYNDPLVVFRVELMDAPAPEAACREALFTKLLELNASDVVHGAYALENGKIILINSLDYATFDYGEFLSTCDAFSLAMIQHYPIIKGIIGGK
jgi:hypothetical protein